MPVCKYCNKEFVRKFNSGSEPMCCCRQHYWKMYYQNHREERLAYFREKHKKEYVPHPIPPKYSSKEEYERIHKEIAREYYHTHKDYYKKKNKEWYAKHKDDEDVKKRHKEAMKRYYQKKKLQNL